MPDGEAAVFVQALRLQARIDALHDKQDALLSPLATSITQDLALRAKEYTPERLADSPATFEISKDGLGCPLGFFGNSSHGESGGGYGHGGVPLRAE